MARMAGLMAVLPVFSFHAVPMVTRVGLTLVLTVFFTPLIPVPAHLPADWLAGALLFLQEALIGLAFGLAARLVYLAVQQGATIAAQQMGFNDAEVIDPTSGEETQPVVLLLEIVFALFFVASGGIRLLLTLAVKSMQSIPVGEGLDVARAAGGMVEAGSAMLKFGLQLAAPLLAGFLVVGLLLCVLARVLPELDILTLGFPLRIAAGLFLAMLIVPEFLHVQAVIERWFQENLFPLTG